MLTHTVTVLIFDTITSVLPTVYSHGCDQQRLSKCSQKMNDSLGSANSTDYDFICRADVIEYVKCAFEEGKACDVFSEYFTQLGISSWTQMEQRCASVGHPISQNAAKQILPSAMIIIGLSTAILVRNFL
ncbi:hypothetical protein ACJMK2_035573 [Sinanodonta woodiana]|uniref:Uncharacterized protein n=1 Tax=Sinanodonta woodiana TaxID=1069815 RepID=A0ABD3WVZ3_SINWO